MDPEEIEKHIGKNYQVEMADIEIKFPQDPLEINENDMPLSLRTEKKKDIESLELNDKAINLQHSVHSSKTDDIL